jgi:Phage protein (N4 Gp49/phage Sf6 gene 66) family
MNEKDIEQEIQEKGLNSPRLTPELIDSKIRDKSFHRLTGVLTVCVLTLRNSFTVTGESACASPDNYDQEIGEKIAFTNAREKIWALEGYLLKEKLFNEAKASS